LKLRFQFINETIEILLGKAHKNYFSIKNFAEVKEFAIHFLQDRLGWEFSDSEKSEFVIPCPLRGRDDDDDNGPVSHLQLTLEDLDLEFWKVFLLNEIYVYVDAQFHASLDVEDPDLKHEIMISDQWRIINMDGTRRVFQGVGLSHNLPAYRNMCNVGEKIVKKN
jgi:hypothetical protein